MAKTLQWSKRHRLLKLAHLQLIYLNRVMSHSYVSFTLVYKMIYIYIYHSIFFEDHEAMTSRTAVPDRWRRAAAKQGSHVHAMILAGDQNRCAAKPLPELNVEQGNEKNWRNKTIFGRQSWRMLNLIWLCPKSGVLSSIVISNFEVKKDANEAQVQKRSVKPKWRRRRPRWILISK